MIQRIQSIYFIFSAMIFGLLFVPAIAFFIDNNKSDQQIAFLQDQVYNIADSIALKIGAISLIVLSLICLFTFKNRKLQKLLTTLTQLASIVYLIFSIFLIINEGYQFEYKEIRFGLAIPIISVIFLLLAKTAVIKDEKLVKSMDRLR